MKQQPRKKLKYLVSENGNRRGPYSAAQLKQLVQQGEIGPDCMIFKEGNSKGHRAGDSKELFPTDTPPAEDVLPTETSEKRKQVFISHSSRDAELATQITNALESSGFSCWIAPRNISPGFDYNGQITAGIRSSDALLFLESRHSVESDQVVREIDAAANLRMPVIPVRIEATQRSESILHLVRTYQWIDAFPGPMGRHLQTIVSGIQRSLSLPVDAPTEEKAIPEFIGPYRIVDVIGEGGMGTVYRAEQRTPIRRTVALKGVKPGLDTKEILARFDSERQALARMDHPNIAHVLDAGADSLGRPYFVMEYVPGESIIEFADKQKLSIEERLKLFVPVCDAIAHAHTKAIIHRDIKPGNILAYMADGKPIVKVIDFGVAKALTADRLTDRTFATQRGFVVGTYEYMSPEQAEGSPDIDTRTDVYSLGVLLYELLTGVKPFESSSLANAADEEIRRVIREVEPPRPSTRVTAKGPDAEKAAAHRSIKLDALASQLRSELEWIPLFAMRKERDRRYATPIDLAEDIQNYLNDRPLQAGPESTAYRLRKFLRRNRPQMIAAAIVLLTLIGGIVGTTLGLFRAESALAKLEISRRESQVVWEVIDEAYSEVQDDQIRHLKGLNSFHEELAAIRVEGFNRLREMSPDDPNVLPQLARAYYIRGSIAGTIGRVENATANLQQAADLYAQMRDANPANSDYGLLRCRAIGEEGYSLYAASFIERAEPKFEEALIEIRALLESDPNNEALRFELANNSLRLASCLWPIERDKKLELLSVAQKEFQQLLESQHRIADCQLGLGLAGYNLFSIGDNNEPKEKRQALSELAKRVDAAAKLIPNSPFIAIFKGHDLQDLAKLEVVAKQYDAAEELLVEAAKFIKQQSADNPDRPRLAAQHAAILSEQAKNQQRQNKWSQSLATQEQSVRVAAAAADRHPDRPNVAIQSINSKMALGEFWSTSRPATMDSVTQTQELIKARDAALEDARLYHDRFPGVGRLQNLLADALQKRMVIDSEANRTAAAKPYAIELFELYRSTIVPNQPKENNLDWIMSNCGTVGEVFKSESELDLLFELTDWVIQLAPRLERDGIESACLVLSTAAESKESANEPDEAIRLYKLILKLAEPALEKAPWHWYLRTRVFGSYTQLSEIYRGQKDPKNEVLALRGTLRTWYETYSPVRADKFLEPDRPLDANEARLIREEIDARGGSMKRFTVPCDFSGTKYPFHVYVTDLKWPKHPLEDQALWLKNVRGGVIPEEVMVSFGKLHKIAYENNVSLGNLCVYALGTAATDGGGTVEVEKIGNATDQASAKPDVVSKIPLLRREAAELKSKAENSPNDLQLLVQVSAAYITLAETQLTESKLDDAIATFENGLQILEQSLKLPRESGSDDKPYKSYDLLARLLDGLADSLTKANRTSEALSIRLRQWEVVEFRVTTSAKDDEPRWQTEKRKVQIAMGDLHRALGDDFSAARLYLRVADDEALKQFAQTAMQNPSVLDLASSSLRDAFAKANQNVVNLNAIPDRMVANWRDALKSIGEKRAADTQRKNEAESKVFAKRADNLHRVGLQLRLAQEFQDAVDCLLEEHLLREKQVGILSDQDSLFAKSDCAFELAKTYAAKNESGEAYKWIAKAALAFNHPESMFEMVKWFEEGLHTEKDMNAAAALKIGAYRVRSRQNNRSGKFAEAIPDLEKLTELEPENDVNFQNLGLAFCKIQKWDEAIPPYRKAFELKPRDAGNAFNLLEALVITQQTDQIWALTGELNNDPEFKLENLAPPNSVYELVYFGLSSIAERLDKNIASPGKFELQFYDLMSPPRELPAGWSFAELDNWFENATLPEETEGAIRNILTEMKGESPDRDSTWFPLEIGHRWVYSRTRSDDPTWKVDDTIVEVTGREKFKGAQWFQLKDYGIVVVRQNGIYVQGTSSDAKINRLLPLPTGKTMTWLNGDKSSPDSIAELTKSDVEVPAGQFKDAWLVTTKDAKTRRVLEQVWFVENIGPVKIEQVKFQILENKWSEVWELKEFLPNEDAAEEAKKDPL